MLGVEEYAMPWKQTPKAYRVAKAKVNARKLRRAPTEAEKVLWKHLRGVPGEGTHFRRQVDIGHYVADFCCLRHRLILELDGPIHDVAEVQAHDANRADYLAAQGFRLLRFTNEDVMLRRDAVLRTINAALAATTPTPGPSPQGGGEWRAP